jgi:hypothetical protein
MLPACTRARRNGEQKPATVQAGIPRGLRRYHLKNRWLPAPSPRPTATPAIQKMAKMTATIHNTWSAKPAPARIKTKSNNRRMSTVFPLHGLPKVGKIHLPGHVNRETVVYLPLYSEMSNATKKERL